jgi:hypothetical protein
LYYKPLRRIASPIKLSGHPIAHDFLTFSSHSWGLF